MTFKFHALPAATFAPLHALDDAALAAQCAVRRLADQRPGFPCRVSLRDADPGEPVLLLNFAHQPARSPYRATYAIYVRQGAEEARPEPGEVPEMLRSRLLAVRGFDAGGMLVDADVIEGARVESLIVRLLAAPAIAYLHVHFARPGCYAARVERSESPIIEHDLSGREE